jgi:hypothetical protein
VPPEPLINAHDTVTTSVIAVYDDEEDNSRFSLITEKTDKRLWVHNISEYQNREVKHGSKYSATYQEFRHEYRDGYNAVIRLIKLD